jgi:hypothetical protein
MQKTVLKKKTKKVKVKNLLKNEQMAKIATVNDYWRQETEGSRSNFLTKRQDGSRSVLQLTLLWRG